jgi:RNA recognition motif-containing protein
MEKHKNVNIDNRKVSLQIADSSKNFEQAVKASLVIFIKKLSKDVVEKDLEDFFRDYKVRQIHLVRDKETKKSKCFAFVEFNDLFNLKRALELQNPKIHGQEILISKSERPITNDMDEYNSKFFFISSDQKGSAPAKKKNALSKKDAIIEEPQHEPPKSEPQDKNTLKKLNFVPSQSSKPVITVIKKAEPTPEQMAKEAKDKEAMPAPKSQNQFRALLKKN